MPSKLDVTNRALQRIGVSRIASLKDGTANAQEAGFCYDQLRRAELRRSIWRFAIRKTALRPIALFNASKLLTFGAWNSATAYAVNDVVLGSDGTVYFSLAGANTGNDPTLTTGYWTQYFGPDVASEYVATWGSGFTYASGDHAVGSDGAVYASLADGNTNHNPVGDNNVHWSLATTTAATATNFYAGELVFIGAAVYLSLQNGNSDTPPSANWRTLSTAPALALPNFIYPIGSGPLSQSETRNVFRLPYGYLRQAPDDPRAGSYTALGAPTNLSYSDWEMGGNYIVSSETQPILLRFVADIADVNLMDDMFREGLSCRIAMELASPLSAIPPDRLPEKLRGLSVEYRQFMGEARLASFIETGPVEPPLDDYLQVRL